MWLWIWSHLLEKSLMENFNFWAAIFLQRRQKVHGAQINYIILICNWLMVAVLCRTYICVDLLNVFLSSLSFQKVELLACIFYNHINIANEKYISTFSSWISEPLAHVQICIYILCIYYISYIYKLYYTYGHMYLNDHVTCIFSALFRYFRYKYTYIYIYMYIYIIYIYIHIYIYIYIYIYISLWLGECFQKIKGSTHVLNNLKYKNLVRRFSLAA